MLVLLYRNFLTILITIKKLLITPTEARSTAKDRPGRRGPANDLYGLQEGEPIEQPGSGPDPGSGRRRYLDRNRE